MTLAPEPRAASRAGVIVHVGLAVFGIAFFAWSVRDLDVTTMARSMSELGPWCALVVVPQAIGNVAHAGAWKSLLRSFGRPVGLVDVTRAFVASEATRLVMPAGAAVAESVAASFLRRLGVPWRETLSSLAAKKAWVLLTHAICLVLVLLFAREPLGRLSTALVSGPGLFVFVGVSALVLAGSGALTWALLSSQRVTRRLLTWLGRIAAWQPDARNPLRGLVERVRGWATERARAPAQPLVKIPHRDHVPPALLMFGQWMTEVIETFLILRLVGIQVSFAEALVIELAGSLVRAFAFAVPGGIGVQDASYVGVIAALGFPSAVEAGAVFVMLRRAKDLFYAALGLVLWLWRPKQDAISADRDEIEERAT